MPLFRITKKLAAVLKVQLPGTTIEQENVEHEWFADLFSVAGKKCVIWAHRSTLFTFVRPAVVVADLRQFHGLFRNEFRTAVASMALAGSVLDRFDINGQERYASTNDRSVIGSMVDYRYQFEHMVGLTAGLEHADIRRINAKLNDAPMSVLGMDSALEAVRKLAERTSRVGHQSGSG